MLDPNTVPIQGWLSRRDVLVLHEFCQGKNVVEFGVGGSTLLLARMATSLISYDTEQSWIDRTNRRLSLILDKTCIPELRHSTVVPRSLSRSDVLFIDGLLSLRPGWMRHFPTTKVLICHDSLSVREIGLDLRQVMHGLLCCHECVGWLDRAYFHYRDSNMLVIYRRDAPIKFVNWELVETEGRLNPYTDS